MSKKQNNHKMEPQANLSFRIRGMQKKDLDSLMESSFWFPLKQDVLYTIYLNELMRQKRIEIENESRLRRIRERIKNQQYGKKV